MDAAANTNARSEYHERLRRYEDRMYPQYALRFNGSKLALEENGKAIVAWPAVSGRPGLQGQQHQLWRDHGPLPSGKYEIDVDQIQQITDWEDIKGRALIPNWTGGRPSWGNYRAWLTPKSDTQTYGRGGFAIHGGSSPGSAGCIDLTDKMDEFVDLMRAIGQNRIDATVDYGRDGAPNHRSR
ncbi:MAG TPA: L,D-transpeptidase [Dongiaceae bacterium]